MIFASTPPNNDDPWPFSSIGGSRHTTGNGGGRFDPRPAFDRPRAHEGNPILLYVREAFVRNPDLSMEAVTWEQMHSIREAEQFGGMATYGFHATPEHVAHARAVFTLWRRIFA